MPLLIKNIKQLVSTLDASVKKVSGAELSKIPSLQNAWLLVVDDKIAAYGEMKNFPEDIAEKNERNFKIIDAEGRFVFPSWCDSHTHIVFAGSREDEFVDKIRGLNYEEIARRGGGILNSVKKLHDTSEESLTESAFQRIEEMIAGGTAAIEIKSGYGLSFDDEIKMLKVIKTLKKTAPVAIKATFLGAHAMPSEFKDNRKGYIDLIINKMLPEIAGQNLADYCDVFCDRGFYTPDETDRILLAASKFGLQPKIHANELDYSGGIQIGVKNHALSVDHLEYTGDAEIEVLLKSETMPVLLPSTAFFLRLPYAPARKMIDAGLPVAIASDYNPGSSPSGKMNLVISLSCIQMKMTPEEAVNAASINGAYAMGLSDTHGSISRGKKANFFITKKMPSLAYLPYAFGSDLIETIVLNGNIYK